MDLNEKAVACRSGKDATAILMSYLESGAAIVQSVQPAAVTVEKEPHGTGAGDKIGLR